MLKTGPETKAPPLFDLPNCHTLKVKSEIADYVDLPVIYPC